MAEKFDAVDVIRTKRDKGVFSPEEIDWVIDAYTRGVVGDEQMAALNMAIFLNGMERREIAEWTAAMIASGAAEAMALIEASEGGQLRLTATDLDIQIVDAIAAGVDQPGHRLAPLDLAGHPEQPVSGAAQKDRARRGHCSASVWPGGAGDAAVSGKSGCCGAGKRMPGALAAAAAVPPG